MTRYAIETQPQNDLSLLINAATRSATRALSTTAPLGEVGKRRRLAPRGRGVFAASGSSRRAARVFGALVVEAWRRGRGRVLEHPVEACATVSSRVKDAGAWICVQ